jgi:hypothetical protein
MRLTSKPVQEGLMDVSTFLKSQFEVEKVTQIDQTNNSFKKYQHAKHFQ